MGDDDSYVMYFLIACDLAHEQIENEPWINAQKDITLLYVYQYGCQ